MKSIYQACMALLIMTIISGVVYPGVITIIGQLVWPKKSNGSLVTLKGRVVGSTLLAQGFVKPEYFWPRPSASSYSAVPSSASNLGPTSQDLKTIIATRRETLAKTFDTSPSHIPDDLVTSSGSGLDPHISVVGARIQVKRVAKARGLGEQGETSLNQLINDHTERSQFSILGEERVNVLALNLALDELTAHP